MRCYATVCKILLCRIFVSDKRQKRDSSHYNSFLLKEKKKRNKLTTPGGTRDKADSWKRCQILSWTLGLLKGLSLSFHPRQCLSQWDKGRCVCKSQSLILWRDPSQLISLVTWAFGGMAWLTPAGAHTLDRNPAAFLSSHGRRDRDVSLQQNFLEGFVFFFFLNIIIFLSVWNHTCSFKRRKDELYPGITSAIFWRICCQNNLCEGSVQTLTASFQLFFISL